MEGNLLAVRPRPQGALSHLGQAQPAEDRGRLHGQEDRRKVEGVQVSEIDGFPRMTGLGGMVKSAVLVAGGCRGCCAIIRFGDDRQGCRRYPLSGRVAALVTLPSIVGLISHIGEVTM